MSSADLPDPASLEAFFAACAAGDVVALRDLLGRDSSLARARHQGGATGLHLAVRHPDAMRRLLSPFEQEQTAVHYVIAPADGLVGGLFRTGDHYRTLEALIDLGADLEAGDAKGRTPLAVAMLRGDWEAMRRLHAAGA